MRRFGVCRICFRELAQKGELPGVVKVDLVVLNIMNYLIADFIIRIKNSALSKRKDVRSSFFKY